MFNKRGNVGQPVLMTGEIEPGQEGECSRWKHHGLTLVTYAQQAISLIESMYLTYITMFKKRVCLYLSDQPQPLQG